MTSDQPISALILRAAELGVFRRATFSKPSDSSVLRTTAEPLMLSGHTALKIVSYLSDGKAIQKNFALTGGEADTALSSLLPQYAQINLMTTVGECEYRRSKGGKDLLIGADKLGRALDKAAQTGAPAAQIGGNDREKNRILRGDEPFLRELGIATENGIHDKKQPKFRQICRFLEYVRDIENELPAEGTLHICDLCCGKSYLSFAVYHYFSVIRGRDVEMTGIDLKPDVMEYCGAAAGRLGFTGMRFLCGNVLEFRPEHLPDLVVSLHACDVATDFVLHLAAGWRTRVILSTPCCQRELAAKLNCSALSFASRYPILRRKLCDALTDSLRLLYLRSEGYSVNACELVDPEDTPKNILLRAVLRPNFDRRGIEAARLRSEYEKTRDFLTGTGNLLTAETLLAGEDKK